jgi:hypothetical protein
LVGNLHVLSIAFSRFGRHGVPSILAHKPSIEDQADHEERC